jgi:hypothetical protein
MRNLFLTGALLAFAATGFSQDCKVSVSNLSLSYTGDCKGGKAEGQGKAVGIDKYDGEFKSGYPEGTGTYTWKEGSWFTGAWKKGLREGQGEMHYKTNEGKDSTITGFWKKDIYQGRFEKPFKVLNQTGRVSSVKVSKNAGNKSMEIAFTVSSTTSGTNQMVGTTQTTSDKATADFKDAPKLNLTEIDMSKGNYSTKTSVSNSAKEAKTVLRGVEFPFKAIFRVNEHSFEIEFFEEGNYSVDVNILQ